MFGNKPTFGTNTGFGSGTFGNTGTPFGQGTTTFGANKPLGTTFGATQPFGTTQPTGTTLFGGGGATSGAANIFGGGATTSTFGQTAAVPATGFGGFGATAGTTGMFGANNQQTTTSGLFGNASASAFGAPKPTFGGFGAAPSPSSVFSQMSAQTTQQPQPGMYNQGTTVGTNLFGGGNVFGAGTSGAATGTIGATSGTTVKFVPVTGTDTMMKNSLQTNINTRHLCITVMKEYENKSLEELRTEDYTANRKGPQSSAVMGFGTTNQPSLFTGGAAPTASGTTTFFGQNQNKSLFGTTNATFGTTTTGMFGQQPQQNVSPFGAKPLGFGTPATTQTSTFNFGNTTTFGTANQPNKSLFGQTAAAPTGNATIFGTTAPTQPAPAFGSFGAGFGTQNQTQPSLFAKPLGFGATTTTAATTPFSFGQSATTNAAGSFAFNQKPAATGFGTTGFGTGTTGFTGFGTAANTNMNLFGQTKPQIGFGQTGFGTGLNMGGSSFFGNTAAKPAGLNLTSGFGGATNTGFGAGTGLTGGQSNFSFGSTTMPNFGSDPSAAQLNQQSSSAQQQLLALASSPYGDSPLFRNIIQDPEKKEEILKPTNPQAQRAVLSASHYKIASRPTVKVKLKPINALNSSRSSLFDGVDEEESDAANDSFLPRRSVKKLVLKSKPQNLSRASISLNESSLMQNQRETAQTPSSSPLRVVRSLSPLRSPLFAPSDGTVERISSTIRSSPSFEVSSAAKNRGPASATSAPDNVPASSRGVHNLDDSIAILNFNRARKDILSPDPDVDDSVSNDDSAAAGANLSIEPEPHPAGIVLRRPGYYTIPSLDELANMVDEDGNCFVENFTIGREGYGNVFFPGITNLAKLNLDEIVHFRRKEVTIYPSDDLKPSVGQGLNKKAQITLDCVWPNDKTTHSPIKSIERLKFLNYQDKLEKVTSRLAAKFIEYRPETGSWVFQVNHFSKYGLEDSDDEDVPNGGCGVVGAQVLQAAPPPKDLLLQQQHLKKMPNGGAQISPPSLNRNGTAANNNNSLSALHRFHATSVPLRLRDDDRDEEMEGILQQTFPDDDGMLLSEEPFHSVSHRLAKAIGTNNDRVQSMKASFFFDESVEERDDVDDDADFAIEDKLDKRAAAESFPRGPVTITDDGDAEHEDVFNHSNLLLEPSQKMRFQQTLNDEDLIRKQKIRKFKGSMSRVSTSSTQQTKSDVFSKLKILYGSGMSPEKLPKASMKHQELLPLDKSTFAGKSHLIADAACFMGRSFRVGWGPNLTLVHPGTRHETSTRQTKPNKLFQPFAVTSKDDMDSSLNRVPFGVTIAMVSTAPKDTSQIEDEIVVSHLRESLEAQLALTRVGTEDGCSLAIPVMGARLIHKHAELAARQANDTSSNHLDAAFLQQSKAVWELSVALWGKLSKQMKDRAGDDNEPADEDTLDAYELHMARREALSDWLSSTSSKIISEEVERHERNASHGPLLSVFSHLTGLQIAEASRAARKARDLSLSVLVSQAGGSCEVRDIVRRQLDHWEETKADRFVDRDRIKVYALTGGCLVWPTSDSAVNCCDDLDWRRAFALHLWYHCFPMASINDALSEYEKAYQGLTRYGPYANPPRPPYHEEHETELEKSVWDTCYHLLKLYCDRTHRLDVLLTPTTSTPDPLDHRLSWLLFQALSALDYSHLPSVQRSNLNSNFASQLITLGLWHWAIFVLMHIEDNSMRKSAVLDVLRRHITMTTTSDSSDRESFLTDRLLIPLEWIYEAKAIRARMNGTVHSEAFFLLKSGHWNQSHKLIVRHIAPDAIINENYDYLKSLLEEIVPSDRSSTVLDWAVGGRVFMDYIHLSQTVDRIIKGELSAYELEGLQPEVTNLCSRVGNIQCRSAKDRLCVSEMAKKTANLLRAVLSLGSGMTPIPSSLVTPQLNKLPLPEDYGMQEFRAVLHSYFLELTSS